MKITGARTEAFSDMRRRALRAAGATARAMPAPVDETAFLGLSPAELTPSVQSAVQTLLTEIEDLRTEVGRLKAKLSEVEDLADRDPLAPVVLNRRALIRELGRIRTFALRYGAAASLAYFDLDGFKGVNDRFGHAAGDAALKAVADRLVSQVRDSDIVGRMGGDEFAVILVQADQQTAETKAASLARGLEKEALNFGDWSWPLHVSWGVRQIDADLEPEAIVAQADAAMYARKRAREG
jgi:diguanylate cyclase (GGDEF)-like protein